MLNFLEGIIVKEETCTIVIVNSEHRSVPATKRKINSVPAEDKAPQRGGGVTVPGGAEGEPERGT